MGFSWLSFVIVKWYLDIIVTNNVKAKDEPQKTGHRLYLQRSGKHSPKRAVGPD